MRSIVPVALFVAACGGVHVGHSPEYPAPPEAALGFGFDSLSGLTKGPCVKPRPERAVERPAAQTIRQVFYARSKEEIVREVGFSGGANFGIAGFGINLGFEVLDRNAVSETTTFAVVRIETETPSRALDDYRLEKHAVETLRRDGAWKFYQKCGDGFVAAIRTGGLFLGVVALDEVSREEADRLAGNAGLSILGFGVNAGASRGSREFLQKHRARYFVFQQGGAPGGPTSVDELQDVDDLLRRANAFERAALAGHHVPKRVIVRPYQVTSNLPRRREVIDLREQRRFLGDLAVEYGELKRARAELTARLKLSDCAGRQRRRVETLEESYAEAIRAVPRRAQDCLENPERQCNDRRLAFVDVDEQAEALSRCGIREVASPFGRPVARVQEKGVDVRCALWQWTSIEAKVARVKENGAPWDADGSPPDLALHLWVHEKHFLELSPEEGYARQGVIQDLFVKPGAIVKMRVVDGDAFAHDDVADAAERVPERLRGGSWVLQGGPTSVTLRGRCVE